MVFEEIVGQDRVVRLLRRAIAAQHLPSGLIFYGIDGVGKRKTAYELARALNCPTGEPQCGCVSCVKIAHESHPDVELIQPDGQFIKMEQVEPLVAGAMLRPFEGSRRVYIFDRAECIREQTASRLLKTLEEPPLFTHFILLTTALPAVLPTIRSRCGLFYFSELTREQVERALMDRFEMAEEEARGRAALCRGSLGRALSLDERDFSLHHDMVGWLESALALGDLAPGELISMIITEGSKTKVDTTDLAGRLEILMDVVREVIVGERQLRGLDGFDSAYKLFRRLMQARALIAGNVNPEAVLEEMIVNIRKEPVAKWTEKLITPLSWV